MPDFFAGPSGFKLETNAPALLARPRLSAISSVTGVICTPNQPRLVLPNSIN